MLIVRRQLLPLMFSAALVVVLLVTLALVYELRAREDAAVAELDSQLTVVRELRSIGEALADLQHEVDAVWAAPADRRPDPAALARTQADLAGRLALLGQRVGVLARTPLLQAEAAEGAAALRSAFEDYRDAVLALMTTAGGPTEAQTRPLARVHAQVASFFRRAQDLMGPLSQAVARTGRHGRSAPVIQALGAAITLALGLALVLAWTLVRAPAGRAEAVSPTLAPPDSVLDLPPAPAATTASALPADELYDALTGLPNRRLVVERLQQAIRGSKRRGSSLAVLFLDLDNFRLLNEVHGYEKGDLLLQGVADRLRHTVRSSDTIGRVGPDEFLVLVEDLPAEPSYAAAMAGLVADKVRATLSGVYLLGGLRYEVSASVGVSLNMDGSPEDIIQAADAALDAIKRAKALD